MRRSSWAIVGLLAAVGGVGGGLLAVTSQPDELSDEQLLERIDPGKPTDYTLLRAELKLPSRIAFVGKPILADFQIVNNSDQPVLVRVPLPGSARERVERKHLVSGLPLSHVFSRRGASEGAAGRRALVISPIGDPLVEVDDDVTYAPAAPAEPIVVRPRGLVGRRIDLAQYYPSLRRPGRYSIQWRPYGDAVRSPLVELNVMNEERAVIETGMGDIEVSFFYDKAPNHVNNFLDLARRGFYDGCQFHRVIEGFMIQGGDPLTKDPARAAEWGTGVGPRMLKQEFNDVSHVPGVLSMARGPDINSASCQFFVVTGKADFLDGQYTAFGRCVNDASIKVAQKISQVARDRSDRPVQPVVIKKVRVIPSAEQATTQPE